MILSSENKYHSLPLFGHFCCRLAVQPECINKELYIGDVKVDSQDYWARLQGFCIKIWESKKHAEEGQNPEHMIPVNKVSWQLSIDLLHNCFIIFFKYIFLLFTENNYSIVQNFRQRTFNK